MSPKYIAESVELLCTHTQCTIGPTTYVTVGQRLAQCDVQIIGV